MQISLHLGGGWSGEFDQSALTNRVATIGPRFEWGNAQSQGFADATYVRFRSNSAVVFSAREARARPLGRFVIGSEATLDGNVVGSVSTGRFQYALALGRQLGGVLATIGLSGGVLRDTGGTFSPHVSARTALSLGFLSLKLQRFDGGSRIRYTDAEITAARRTGIVSFSLAGGVRAFDHRRAEVVRRAQIAVQPNPFVAFDLSAGETPRSPEGFASGDYLTLGVRLIAAKRVTRPVIERTGSGARVAFAESGRDVTIAGDWNDWTPVPMTLVGGRWTVELPLGAGAHKFVLTVDGKQVVPRGVPKLPDGFGGEVGLLVIG